MRSRKKEENNTQKQNRNSQSQTKARDERERERRRERGEEEQPAGEQSRAKKAGHAAARSHIQEEVASAMAHGSPRPLCPQGKR